MSIELVDIEAFLPDLITELPDCPVPVLERRLRDAVIEACERAPIWQYQMPEIPVAIGQTCYELPTPPGQTRVHDVVRLFSNACPLRNVPLQDTRDNIYNPVPHRGGPAYHILKRGEVGLNSPPTRASDSLRTTPDPRQVRGLDVLVTLTPTRDADRIAQCIYDDYYQLVIDGTLGYAFGMRDTPWYDPGVSDKYKVAFEYEIAKAKQAYDQGFADRPVRVRPRRF